MMGKTRHPRRKDSGYSWLVMVAAFACNTINGGYVAAPGLLLLEWYIAYPLSTATVAWLPAVAVLTRSLSSVLVGGLVHRFGCRLVLNISSLGGCLFLIICSFVYNFQLLVFAFAAFGFCHGIMFAVPVVVIYEYFDKYKSVASGLSMCGHSCGAFVMVPLYRYCIDTYGWRGTMLIMAGIALNSCVGGMLFAPNVEKNQHLEDSAEQPTEDKDCACNDKIGIHDDVEEDVEQDKGQVEQDTRHVEQHKGHWELDKGRDDQTENKVEQDQYFLGQDNGYVAKDVDDSERYKLNTELRILSKSQNKPLKQRKASNSIREILSCSGLHNCNYILLLVAYCVVWCNLNMLLVLSPSRAVSKGLGELKASYLVLLLGFFSTLSRIVIACVSHMECTSHIGLFTGCLFFMSVLIAASCAIAENFVFSAVMISLCGMMIAGPMTLFPATLVDILGQEGLARGYGVANAAAGPVTTLILPLAGWIYDLTGDFNNPFYLSSGLGVLASCLCMVVVVRMHCGGRTLIV